VGRASPPPRAAHADAGVAAVRRFNRFYTRQIGVLREGLLQTPFSLTDVRVLYELAHQDHLTAQRLAAELGIDQGYLSRILARFTKARLLASRRSPTDARQRLLSLTAAGRRIFADLDARANEEIAHLLAALSPDERTQVVAAMHTIESALGPRSEPQAPYVLRPPTAGDMGWVVQRHGAFYAQTHGYSVEFEALVAKIVAGFVEHHDPQRERCWIAERAGARVGSVFLVKKSERVAQLRLLFVEPHARGLGIGQRLVAECERFGRDAGYRKVTLWTQSHLDVARHVYERAGYQLVRHYQHHSFGQDLVGEIWERTLER
jgi:DNA-binding MarR family transcriptional regulator/GNAT superfamily N-acetyltransferase